MSSIIIGPLIALIPGSVLLLQLEKESLLIFYNSKHRHDMLKSDAKNMIYKYISLIYILGGFFTVVYEYFFGGFSLVNSLILGGIISTIGLILKVTLNSKVSIYKKDNLVCIIISLFITFLMFFLLISGSGTLWPTPFIFMIAFMLYNNSRMIIGISIAIFSSLFVISVIVPYNEVTLNSTDHFLRLFLTFLIAAFAFAVNHFYIAKLKEIEEQYRNVNILNRIT